MLYAMCMVSACLKEIIDGEAITYPVNDLCMLLF